MCCFGSYTLLHGLLAEDVAPAREALRIADRRGREEAALLDDVGAEALVPLPVDGFAVGDAQALRLVRDLLEVRLRNAVGDFPPYSLES